MLCRKGPCLVGTQMSNRSFKDMKAQRATIIMLISLFILASSAFACSVPVFRYAMERWPADFYDAVLIRRGPMTEEQKQLQNKLQEENYEAEAPLNLRLLEVDEIGRAHV